MDSVCVCVCVEGEGAVSNVARKYMIYFCFTFISESGFKSKIVFFFSTVPLPRKGNWKS